MNDNDDLQDGVTLCPIGSVRVVKGSQCSSDRLTNRCIGLLGNAGHPLANLDVAYGLKGCHDEKIS